MNYLTGGANGLLGIPRKVKWPIALASAIVSITLVAMFKRSKYGRQCIAVKSDELAAEAMGIDSSRIKMIVLLLSCALNSLCWLFV